MYLGGFAACFARLLRLRIPPKAAKPCFARVEDGASKISTLKIFTLKSYTPSNSNKLIYLYGAADSN